MKGIYLIRCNGENKVYIGQSSNIKKRYVSHLVKLRKNRHENIYLQNAFNDYGEESFSYEVLFEQKQEKLNRQELYDLEIYYISMYDSTNRCNGYNIEKGGKSYGRVAEETRKKISESHKGKTHSLQTRKKFSEIRKGKPSHLKGKKQTKEHIEKRTKIQNGKVWINNGTISRFVTKEECEILLKQGFNIGRNYFTRNTGKYEYNGQRYSLCEISRMCGIGRSLLFYRLKNGWSMEKATTTPVKK